MDERFNKFIAVILRHEGGYVNDPDDKGSETNMGISSKQYPNLDIKNLTIDQVKEIYYEDYYLKLRLDLVKLDLLALHLFDMGVNAGIKRAVILLQQLLGMLVTDGIIGPHTVQEIDLYKGDIIADYIKERIEYYTKISLIGNNAKFLVGWIKRVNSTKLD
jgi:lysozyme family protein